MKLYSFARLINKYSVTFRLKKESGRFVAGKWVDSDGMDEEMRGAIVPMSDRKIYSSGGTYTSEDRELYLTKPLTPPLSAYNVIYKGNTYAVEEGRNFEDYADVAIYTLKRVSKT